MEGTFTLEDFLEQMQQVKKMGPLGSLVGMIPGMPKEMRNTEIDDREIARIEGIIHSMTIEERRNPKLIDGSRRSRSPTAAGSTTADVNGLLNQFNEVQKMMQQLRRWRSPSASRRRRPRRVAGSRRRAPARLDAEGRQGPVPAPGLELTRRMAHHGRSLC